MELTASVELWSPCTWSCFLVGSFSSSSSSSSHPPSPPPLSGRNCWFESWVYVQ